MLDRDCAEDVLERFLDWLATSGPAAGVVFPRLVENGPLHRALLAASRRTGRAAATLERFERAMLAPGSDPDELWTRGAGKKALKDLHRRRRRLAEQGALEFSIASSPREVRDALERFLTLEASGWKGKSGALLAHAALSAFSRGATRLLAREGKCRVASLTLAGRPLAMGVVILSRGRAYFWKIAFDEEFRAQAPGIHLLYELTRALSARADIDMTDSCAIANHPMIDRFWPDRSPSPTSRCSCAARSVSTRPAVSTPCAGDCGRARSARACACSGARRARVKPDAWNLVLWFERDPPKLETQRPQPRVRLKPASPTVPAPSAKDEKENDDDEECLSIHDVRPFQCFDMVFFEATHSALSHLS